MIQFSIHILTGLLTIMWILCSMKVNGTFGSILMLALCLGLMKMWT